MDITPLRKNDCKCAERKRVRRKTNQLHLPPQFKMNYPFPPVVAILYSISKLLYK